MDNTISHLTDDDLISEIYENEGRARSLRKEFFRRGGINPDTVTVDIVVKINPK